MTYSVIFNGRLAKLAEKIGDKPVTLVMPDGAEHTIGGSLAYHLRIMDCLAQRDRATACGEPLPQSIYDEHITWLETAVEFKDDRFHLSELTAAMIIGPEQG